MLLYGLLVTHTNIILINPGVATGTPISLLPGRAEETEWKIHNAEEKSSLQ